MQRGISRLDAAKDRINQENRISHQRHRVLRLLPVHVHTTTRDNQVDHSADGRHSPPHGLLHTVCDPAFLRPDKLGRLFQWEWVESSPAVQHIPVFRPSIPRNSRCARDSYARLYFVGIALFSMDKNVLLYVLIEEPGSITQV